MAQAYLSAGSNVGNRQKFLRRALRSISDFCEITKVSSVYETEPWGKLDQPRFLNLCLAVKTSLHPQELLNRIKDIEIDIGRTKTTKWGEREIDIDILFYGSKIVRGPSLALPHPRIEERAFVLVPLAEIAPNFIHPVLKKTIRQLVQNTGSKGVSKLVQVMGVINATPDSFSDGGELKNKDILRQKVQEMISAGADIIDIGGESTRPGHRKVETSEEISRVLPVVKSVREISSDILISIDTQKSEVASKALEAGADMINDVSALSDPKMPEVIKEHGCQVILMRNKPLDKKDLVGSCRKQFEEIVRNCGHKGIGKDKIILDPGLGFGELSTGDFASLPGSNPSSNTQLILSIDSYSLGLPVLIGASRKRFLGTMSGQGNAKLRLAESLSFAVLAKYSGAAIVRVHDVRETIQALREI